MNERIKELATLAGAKIYTESTRSGEEIDFFKYTGFDLENFAKLLVAECADVGSWNGDGEVSGMIKNHFGVEE